jgi:cysteine synthase B
VLTLRIKRRSHAFSFVGFFFRNLEPTGMTMNTLTLTQAAPVQNRFRSNAVWAQVGNTPLLPFSDDETGISPRVRILGKAEWGNPGGSIKDRPAYAILRQAMESGILGGRTFLDSTSGNMGISYATLAASVGIPIHLAIPANVSPERLAILKALGARLTLTDPLEGSDGAREVASEMAHQRPGKYYYADQYSHPANWQSHYQTTGPELLQQTSGRITHLVAGLGTTGTVTGTGRYLRDALGDVRVIGVQPDGPFHGLEGLKHLATSPVPGIYDPSLLDEVIEISTADTYAFLRKTAREKGVMLGISAGAALLAALQVARRLEEGLVVAILPDSGAKYLSNPLWEAA